MFIILKSNCIRFKKMKYCLNLITSKRVIFFVKYSKNGFLGECYIIFISWIIIIENFVDDFEEMRLNLEKWLYL